MEVENNQNLLNGFANETIFTTEMTRLKEAEVLMASLEEYVLRRYSPRPSAYIGKGKFDILKKCCLMRTTVIIPR